MAAHTVVGSSVVISGNVAGDGDVTVNGRLDGSVELMATLTVGPAALVKADLNVARAVIAGVVVGNITAKDGVELLAGARVVGDVITPRFSMQDGALFRGAVRETGSHARANLSPSSAQALMPSRPSPREEIPARPAMAHTRVDLLRPAIRDDVQSRPPARPVSRPPEPIAPPAPAPEAPAPERAPPVRAPRARPARAQAPTAAPTIRVPPPPPLDEPLTPPDDEEEPMEEPKQAAPAPARNPTRPPLTPPEARPLPGRGQKQKVVVKRR